MRSCFLERQEVENERYKDSCNPRLYRLSPSQQHKTSVQRKHSSINVPTTTFQPQQKQQSIIMPMRRTHHTTAAPRTTARTTRARPSLKTRLLGGGRATRRTPAATTTTTTTTKTTRTTHGAGAHGAHGAHGTHGATTAHHHKRHATMGDKVSGALMKLRGSLTRRPGLKVSYRLYMNDGRLV